MGAGIAERLGALADPQGAAAEDGAPDVLAQARFEQDAPTLFAGALAVTGDAGISCTVAEVSPATLRRCLAQDLVGL